MRLLTPELHLFSALSAQNATESDLGRELDFNLARRGGVLVNKIIGQLFIAGGTLTGFDEEAGAIQEVDLDPDNTTVEIEDEAIKVSGYEMDSSRIFRQRIFRHFDTATGSYSAHHTLLTIDWTNKPYNERPVSVTNLRHNAQFDGDIVHNAEAEVHIMYHIVELSPDEVGMIYASRR